MRFIGWHVLVLGLLLGCGSSKRTIGGNHRSVGSGGTSGAAGSAATGAGQAGTAGSATGKGGKGGKGGNGGDGGEDTGAGGTAGSIELPPNCGVPATSQLPRLTNEQYDRTVAALLEVYNIGDIGVVPPSSFLQPDHDGDLTAEDWAGYLEAGESVAFEATRLGTLQDYFFDCAPDSDDVQCLDDSIMSFGRRAFRRPLSQDEMTRFHDIAAQGAAITPNGSREEIANVLVNTFLVSPSFLQRSEVATTDDGFNRFVLSPYEVASRLSYTLWGSMPDETLDRTADANELVTPEQIRAQAERMLADPRARPAIAAFHRFYLRMGEVAFGHWDNVSNKDPALFPTLTPSGATAIKAETAQFFESVTFDHLGTFQDFFTSPLGYVNAETAPFYGLDPSAFDDTLAEVTLDPAQRPGFLTRGAFLGAYSHYDSTSPILRGAFIVNVVQGINTGSDVGFADVPPPVPEPEPNRQRTDRITAGAACVGCHRTYLNPPGFALESFDAVGRWQTVEAATGLPVDTTADVIIDGSPVTVSGPEELMKALSTSRDATTAYARSWVSYAYQRVANPEDECTVAELSSRLTEGGYTVLDLFVDLTQTDAFRLRVQEQP